MVEGRGRVVPRPQDQDNSQRVSIYRLLKLIELIRFIPLIANGRVPGILYLRMRRPRSWFASQERMDAEEQRANSRVAFFWTFLEQVSSLLERTSLRYEATYDQP